MEAFKDGDSSPRISPECSGNVEESEHQYMASELVRPLLDWEISRDYLVFSCMCGITGSQRHILHVLEPSKAGEHDGVLLTAVGNTVQLLTLAPRVAASGSTILYRRYLFGFGGSGIGSLAVHPSRKYFAVGDKGAKPIISIHRYPQLTVSHVLRNGTDRAYASVEFSKDGSRLASVGSAPDYLLTVWNWQEEHTLLRCKAFGQEVFQVRFAPMDSAFLATSGVGHIRFWKMAATFTGLKLQGDIGKFGKTELSDIEAFCVLPDKKVLSGTERGVLLLWDGNFIKCELLTSRGHLPHVGKITVVTFDDEEREIVTAGTDGYVRFWSFDSIDSADIVAGETVAFVPLLREVLVELRSDICAIVKKDIGQYFVQDRRRGIHVLQLKATGECQIQLDYIRNDTGQGTGIVCSPYEHLAVTCGIDGSVRAWDYVSGSCLMTLFPEETVLDNGNGSNQRAAASSIAWTPNSVALINDGFPASRQVAVGFEDGLVRVLLLNVEQHAWIRTNVFKPHSKRVTCMAYSHSGSAFVTASADKTFFLFRILPSEKSSTLSKCQFEYEPCGFQRVAASVVAICWRDDDEAVLVTLANGQVIEFFLLSVDLTGKTSKDRQELEATPVNNFVHQAEIKRESYELELSFREWKLQQRNRFMSVKELEALEAQTSDINAPLIKTLIHNEFLKSESGPVKALAAHYTLTPKSSPKEPSDFIYLSCQAPLNDSLFVLEYDRLTPVQELASDAMGEITSITLSTSQRFILCGLSNGRFQLRSSSRPHAFITGEFHDTSLHGGGRLHLALSFDDSHVVAVGSDGNLSISHLQSKKVEEASRLFANTLETMLAEATMARHRARDNQEMLLKGVSDKGEDDSTMVGSEERNTELSALPAFHGAKAYATCIESILVPSLIAARRNEKSQVTNAEIIREPSSVWKDCGLDAKIVEVSPVDLSQFSVDDLANPKEAYTIEDAKLKREADERAKSTLCKQVSTKAVIAKLRAQFQELVAQDAALLPHNRLDPDEWKIDGDYFDLLTRQGEEICNEVHKELAYALEKEELLLLKMRQTFTDPIAAELITLRALESGLSVQSFRIMKMPATLEKKLAEIHSADAAAKTQQSTPMKVPGAARHSSVLDIIEPNKLLKEKGLLKEDGHRMVMNQTEPVGSMLIHGFEARKRLRTERKEKLAHWIQSKPGEDADDPRDSAAIAFALCNMGDYKLKTAADYVVPEHQRFNAARKFRQLALLDERLYCARLRFNAKVLELRERKVQLIRELQRDQDRLAVIRGALPADTSDELPSLCTPSTSLAGDLREWPEQRDHVSEADIDLFLQEKKVPHSKTHSLTGTGSAESPDQVTPAVTHAHEASFDGSQGSKGITVRHLHLQMDRLTALVVTPATSMASLSTTLQPFASLAENVDEDEIAVHKYLMRREALQLQRKQRRKVAAFDAAVAQLRREKITLEIEFKQTELRLSTLLSELTLLESFESRDNQLSSKLEKSKGEKAQIRADLQQVNDLVTSKKHELEKWIQQDRAVQTEFQALVDGETGSSGAPHPCFAPLQKLFKRKIKRVKKKSKPSVGKEDGKDGNEQAGNPVRDDEGQEDDDEEEEEEEEEDDDDDDDDDCDEDDDEEEEDICPPGCDLMLYEKVLLLREKRVDVEVAMGDLNRTIEELRKAGERQMVKLRALEKELAGVELATQHFQSEKQSHFNQLDIVVPLNSHQLRCLEPSSSQEQDWSVPFDATGCLVFSTRALTALIERIESLQAENQQLRQQFRDLHKQQNVLARNKSLQLEAIAQAQDRSEQLQRLKFGQLVDLEVLDSVGDASSVDELQTRVKLREVEGERTLRRKKKTHPQLQHAILQVTEQNTALLSQIAALSERQAELEREFNRNQGSEGSHGLLNDQDEAGVVEREMKERNKLVRLVKLQAREIEALKQEIGLLSGKAYAARGSISGNQSL